MTIEIGRAGFALRGVAGDERAAYAALTGGGKCVVEAYRGTARAWQSELPGEGGPLAAGGGAVYVADSARPPALAVRGDPGAVVIALDAATGAKRWQLAVDATEWVQIAGLAALPGGGVVAGGSFAGNLRIGGQVVTSAGDSDGVVARIDARGGIVWLIRLGGNYADAVQGVAARGDAIAIAGTFTSGAELQGQPLVPNDPRSPMSDAFVAELDGLGARRWATSYGGKPIDAVGGVTIDARGRVIVAGTARGTLQLGGGDLEARGAADGLVGWFERDGEKGTAVLVGGSDFDGASAIAAVDDRVVVAGFFSGSLPLGPRTLSAGGGDDAYVALLDASGDAETSWQVGGDGREDIVGLAAIPGGFVAGIRHTANALIEGGAPLPLAADPMAGAALIVRGVR